MEDTNFTKASITPADYTGYDNYETKIGQMDTECSMEEKWQALLEDWENGSIIEGVVSSVQPYYKKRTVTIVAEVGGFSVMIPEHEYFSDKAFKKNFYTDTINNQMKRKMQKAKASLNSRVRFVITKMSDYINDEGMKEFVIMGSRLKAMSKIREEWRVGTEKHPPLKNGDIIDASVYSVGEFQALLEGFGMEIVLKNDKITKQKFIKNVADELHVKDNVQMMIQKIHLNEDGTYFILASAAALETYRRRVGGSGPSGI